MNLCAPTLIPSFSSIFSLIPHPLPTFTIPSLPCLKSPPFSAIIHPELSMANLVHELQTYQFFAIFLSIFTPIVSFLGGSLSTLLPKLPIIGIGLLDILALTPTTLYNLINEIPSGSLSSFPSLPTPIFQNLIIPELELLNKVKFITTGYMTLLISTLVTLIGNVTSMLRIAGLPSLPTIPSFAAFESLLLAPFSGASNLLAVLKSGTSIQSLFNITVPGFPALPSLPNPLIPNFISPEIYLMEFLKIMNAELASFPLLQILNFCTGPLSSLGFSFSTLCISI